MSPDLEPQGAENVEPTPLPPAPDTSSLPWTPTRRWLINRADALAWSIEERESPDGPSLFFTNDDGFVRVRAYPSNWRELPEAVLAELLQNPRGPLAKPA